MSKANKSKQNVTADIPKCPICGRRSTVRRIDESAHYCDHCRQAFAKS